MPEEAVLPQLVAILDACVLVPASLCDTLLRAADARLYVPAWSDEILNEVQRSLVEHGLTGSIEPERRVYVMKQAFPWASVPGYEDIVDQMTNHPDDRHVLAAAVVAWAERIVTHNLRDFPAPALAPLNVVAQSPDEVLQHLFARNPRSMLRIIQRQAAELRRPPATTATVLRSLAHHAPRFVQLVGAVLG